jgi:fructuronate reductase
VTRLSASTLRDLPPSVRRPAYERSELRHGILHIGLGAFHRAHQAAFTEDAIEHRGGGDPARWGIVGVCPRRPDIRDSLAPQDGLYTLLERGGAAPPRVIGCVTRVLLATETPHAAIDLIADPATRIVSLTVTEKGYGHDPASGRLRHEAVDVAHDIAAARRTDAGPPRSIVGLLAAGLDARHQAKAGPVTIMSCDNLPANGRLLRGLVREFGEAARPALLPYLDEAVAFPCSMVDRIVPATTEEDRIAVASALGLEDRGAVVGEPFRQWVIEDDFRAGRPDWDAVGVELARDVAPYEEMKLRLLNAAHSALAYLGFLAGHRHIRDAIADPPLAAMVAALHAEIIPTLRTPQVTDLPAYCRTLIERFANRAIAHETRQIAMDGSQKLPQRLLATVLDRLRLGRTVYMLALAVAGWMRYAMGFDDEGRPFEVADPLAPRLAAIASAAGRNADALTRGFLGIEAIFGNDLPQAPTFVSAVRRALCDLLAQGTRATLLTRLEATHG